MATKSSSTVMLYVRGEEKGENRISFVHDDFSNTRKIVMREWLFTAFVLFTFVLAALSIFWGAFIHVEQNLGSLSVFVVNFDNGDPGFIGDHVVQLAERLSKTPGQLGFEVLSPERFSHDPLSVRQAVYDFEAWAAIVVRPNASSTLQQAVAVGDRSYDPNSAAEIVYVEARDPSTIPTYILPALNEFTIQAVDEIGEAWVQSVLKNSTIPLKALAAAPKTLNPAVGFTTVDLRPFAPPQATPAVTVGALYLIILSFFSFAFFLPTHSHFINELEGHRKLYFHHLMFWKWCSAVSAYFWMSLAYSLVSLAFQIPFSNPPASPVEPSQNPTAYGHASFFVFWMVNWLGMIALGLASENIAMILDQPYPGLWLIFWVICNVCTALYPIQLAPRFYCRFERRVEYYKAELAKMKIGIDYGWAFPLHNVVEASKQILFDLHSRIGLNVGVLVAWMAVNTALFPVCGWYFRHKHLKAKERAKQKG